MGLGWIACSGGCWSDPEAVRKVCYKEGQQPGHWQCPRPQPEDAADLSASSLFLSSSLHNSARTLDDERAKRRDIGVV